MERPKHYGKWGQRGVIAQTPQREGCCRYCGDPLKKGTGFRAYCNQTCRDEMWLRISWNTMRFHIIKRDEVCKLCDGASYKQLGRPWEIRRVWDETCRAYADHCALESEWHVDHIKPVSEGGTDDPANLRLLCGKCHKRITKEWHGERVAARRPQITLV